MDSHKERPGDNCHDDRQHGGHQTTLDIVTAPDHFRFPTSKSSPSCLFQSTSSWNFFCIPTQISPSFSYTHLFLLVLSTKAVASSF